MQINTINKQNLESQPLAKNDIVKKKNKILGRHLKTLYTFFFQKNNLVIKSTVSSSTLKTAVLHESRKRGMIAWQDLTATVNQYVTNFSRVHFVHFEEQWTNESFTTVCLAWHVMSKTKKENDSFSETKPALRPGAHSSALGSHLLQAYPLHISWGWPFTILLLCKMWYIII